jgi:hypothetical protein
MTGDGSICVLTVFLNRRRNKGERGSFLDVAFLASSLEKCQKISLDFRITIKPNSDHTYLQNAGGQNHTGPLMHHSKTKFMLIGMSC